jgi:hypothetical protein
MKNLLVYILTFLIAAGVGVGAMFFIKNGQSGKPEPVSVNAPVASVQDVRQEEEQLPVEEAEATEQEPAPEEETPAVSVQVSGSASLVVIVDKRKVEDASGPNFKVSGFSVEGATGNQIEYHIYNSKTEEIRSFTGSPAASGSFEVPSNATYYITATDLQSGLVSDPADFKLGRKLTKAKLESVLNERANFDSVEREATSLCAPGYKVSCAGYSASSIAAVNGLYLDYNELANKRAVVSNIKYNSIGKVTSFAVTMQ